MRSIETVIDSIVAEIPKEDSRYNTCRKMLGSIKETAQFRAPEMERASWMELSMALESYLPNPTDADAPEWVLKIKTIMLGENAVGPQETKS